MKSPSRTPIKGLSVHENGDITLSCEKAVALFELLGVIGDLLRRVDTPTPASIKMTKFYNQIIE